MGASSAHGTGGRDRDLGRYVSEPDEEGAPSLNLVASYAFKHRKHLSHRFALQEVAMRTGEKG